MWCDARELLVTGGWRSGKTTTGAFKAFKEALNPKTKLIWLLGPDYPQSHEEMRFILEWGTRLDVITSVSLPAEGSRFVVLRTGCRIETKSARHPERLGSVALDGVVMCEPGQMSGEAYDMVIGRIAEKRGWIVLVGTLEDELNKPRWRWFEDLATSWERHSEGAEERAFRMPSWENLHIYPGGINDPEIQRQRSKLGDYTFRRRIAGEPVGVENPVFPLLWEPEAEREFFHALPQDTEWAFNGAMGVDFGASGPGHPSAVVAIRQTTKGDFWVRELWMQPTGNPNEIAAVVESMKLRHRIYFGRTDPNEAVLASILGFNKARGGATGGQPSGARFGIANGLLEDRRLFFDRNGPNVREVWASMKRMQYRQDKRGRLIYAYDPGDDAGQATMYALEELCGEPTWVPPVQFGSVRMSYEKGTPPIERL